MTKASGSSSKGGDTLNNSTASTEGINTNNRTNLKRPLPTSSTTTSSHQYQQQRQQRQQLQGQGAAAAEASRLVKQNNPIPIPPISQPPLKRIRPNLTVSAAAAAAAAAAATTKKTINKTASKISAVKSPGTTKSNAKNKLPPVPKSNIKTSPSNRSKAATTPQTNHTQAPQHAPPQAPPQAPPNLYDAMLGEISDLISAAQEAQSCGRLKMASTYQLLVHARLVGLGKRFDRFLCHNHDFMIRSKNNGNHAAVQGQNQGQTQNQAVSSSTTATTAGNTEGYSQSTSASSQHNNSTDNTNHNNTNNSIKTAQAALAKILPSEVHLDYTMMEHLARAAMELHNKRTGRGMLYEKEIERKLYLKQRNSAIDKAIERKFDLQQRNSAINSNNSVPSPHKKQQQQQNASPDKSNGTSSTTSTWSVKELHNCKEAAALYGWDDTPKIAEYMRTRTEAEVKAYVENMKAQKLIMDSNHLESSTAGTGTSNNSNTISTPRSSMKDVSSRGGRSASTYTTPNSTASNVQNSPGESKKKGRGKKPPPRAMLTVSNTTFNAKRMLFDPI